MAMGGEAWGTGQEWEEAEEMALLFNQVPEEM